MLTEEEIIPFEKMPAFLVKIRNDIRDLREMLEKELEINPHPEEWMDLDQLCKYHPNHPAKKTVYDWGTNGRIPYHN